jgi:hypothetical protein
MYGSSVPERITSGYNSIAGKFVPDMVIPAGYSGLICGSIIRKFDGMEMDNDDFWNDTLDANAKFVHPLEAGMDLGDLIYMLVNHHFSQHIGGKPNRPFGWQIDSNPSEGFVIDFFLPEKVHSVPNLEFIHRDEEFYIEFMGDESESCPEEDN